MVEVWSVLAASTPTVPKFSVEALLIVQVAVIVAWTAKVDVVLAAYDAFAKGIRKQAASAALYPLRTLALDCMQYPHQENYADHCTESLN
jgi:hypothetical protein